MVPGAACVDAPVAIDGRPAWLLDALGSDFTLLRFADGDAAIDVDAAPTGLPLHRVVVVRDARAASTFGGATVVHDVEGLVAARYDATSGHRVPDPPRPARLRALADGDGGRRARCARPRMPARRRTRMMTGLNVDANLAHPDDFYERLIELHRDLSRDDSELVNCKLILLLANHIGDDAVLRDAMARARDGVGAPDPERKESR